MSFTLHETDEVFAALRGMCSNSYRMYDPSEYRSYYDHDCETYECAVEDAAREYERLLKHCTKQRDELAGLKDPERKERIDRMKWELSRTEGRTMERTKTEQGSSITDELRGYVQDWRDTPSLMDDLDRGDIDGIFEDFIRIADRIDKRAEADVCCEYTRGYTAGFNEASDGIEAADELRERIEREYVKLPVDADGEIWTGNERVFEVGNGTRYDMRYLMYDGEKWIIDSSFGGFIANECRHHREPTVEDVLFSYGQSCIRISNEAETDAAKQTMLAKLREEYAAKLRLAEEAE